MTDLSGWLASIRDVALPTLVVSIVMSPFIVEVLGRSVLRSGLAMLPPILLLGTALLLLRSRQRRSDAARGRWAMNRSLRRPESDQESDRYEDGEAIAVWSARSVG